MAEQKDWEIPAAAQPKRDELSFELDPVLRAAVTLRVTAPEDAFTAPMLGTERTGNGMMIGDGLVLTIGYLVTEADSVWALTSDGRAIQGHVAGYDHETGFGLVQLLTRDKLPSVEFGNSGPVNVGDPIVFTAGGGKRHALAAQVVSRRRFVGSWEYVIDDAIFTAPAHPSWGGSGLIDQLGQLIGIGSLYVQQAKDGLAALEGNMAVPIDLVKPILPDLIRYGRVNKPARAWLGLYAAQAGAQLVVAGLAPRGPAARGDIRVGDELVEIAGEPVDELGSLFRKVWSLGPAGSDVPLTVKRDGRTIRLTLKSADRQRFMKSPRLQ